MSVSVNVLIIKKPQSRELLIQLVIKSVIYCRHMQIEQPGKRQTMCELRTYRARAASF